MKHNYVYGLKYRFKVLQSLATIVKKQIYNFPILKLFTYIFDKMIIVMNLINLYLINLPVKIC